MERFLLLFVLGRGTFVFGVELFDDRCAGFECMIGDFLLPTQLVGIGRQNAQDLHATLPVEFHRVQGVYDRLHALSRLAHTLQNADKCLVHIFAHELLKFAEAHLGNFGKDLCPLVHGGNHLPVGGACRFGLLPQCVKGAGETEDGLNRDIYVRRRTGRPFCEVNDKTLGRRGGHADFVDCRADLEHTLLDAVLFSEVENIDEFSDLLDGGFGIAAEVSAEGDPDFISGTGEFDQILLSFDTEFTRHAYYVEQ